MLKPPLLPMLYIPPPLAVAVLPDKITLVSLGLQVPALPWMYIPPPTSDLFPEIKTSFMVGLQLLVLPTARLKIAPPLCIPEDAFLEGVDVIDHVLSDCVRAETR